MKNNDKRFLRVYKQSDWSGYQYIWVDRETRIQYLVMAYGQGCGLTPLLDAEGKPLLYDGELSDDE